MIELKKRELKKINRHYISILHMLSSLFILWEITKTLNFLINDGRPNGKWPTSLKKNKPKQDDTNLISFPLHMTKQNVRKGAPYLSHNMCKKVY